MGSCFDRCENMWVWSSIKATKLINVLQCEKHKYFLFGSAPTLNFVLLWKIGEPNKLLFIKAIYLALLSFTKEQNSMPVHFQTENICTFTYLLKMVFIHNLEILKIAKEIQTFLLCRDVNYSRVSDKQIECGGRLGASKESEFFRMDVESKGFSEDISEKGNVL